MPPLICYTPPAEGEHQPPPYTTDGLLYPSTAPKGKAAQTTPATRTPTKGICTWGAAVPNITTTETTPLVGVPPYTHTNSAPIAQQSPATQQQPTKRKASPASKSRSPANQPPTQATSPTPSHSQAPKPDAPSRHEPRRSAVGPPYPASESSAAAKWVPCGGGDNEARSPDKKPREKQGPAPRPPQPRDEKQQQKKEPLPDGRIAPDAGGTAPHPRGRRHRVGFRQPHWHQERDARCPHACQGVQPVP